MSIYINSYDAISEKNTPYQSQMHSHDFYEIYCFLEGDAEYCVEGRRYALHPGDMVLLRKGEVHKVALLSSRRYHRIGVHFDLGNASELPQSEDLLTPFLNRPSGKFNHYPAAIFPDNHRIHYLQQIVKNEKQGIYYLLPLLCELTDAFPILQRSELFAEKDTAAPIMKYINQNLTEKITLENLSQKFHISQTHLNRLFRQSASTTVWEYITIKRLFLAQEMLKKGQSPTTVYMHCGFQEYSTFYRSYKRYFGIYPSKQVKASG